MTFGIEASGGSGPGPIDHILIVAITILLPLHDLIFWFPRLRRATGPGLGRARSRAYLESAIIEWALVILVLLHWITSSRPIFGLGFGPPAGWRFWLASGIVIGALTFTTWQRISLTRNKEDKVRREVMAQLEHLRPLLPHTRNEMIRFVLLSMTAGICEEILFRGYLLWYLSCLVPAVAAWLAGALLFGMAHAYQGSGGVLRTGLVGAGLVALYLISGSLWLPMLLHAFVDVNSGLLAYAYLKHSEPAELAVADPVDSSHLPS
jgi:membrane protease YdiL (CAAX protease family)